MNNFLESLRRLVNLCRKELVGLLKDPSSRSILIFPSLVQSILFGYAATFNLTNVPYALLDQSHGGVATQLIARFDGTGVFHRVATLQAPADIARVIESGQALLVLQIGPEFESHLTRGESAPLQVILDGRNSTTAWFAASYINTVVAGYNATLPGAQSPPLTIRTHAWYNPNFETRWSILLAMIAALSMMQTLLLSALCVAQERESGTFDQLLVTPCSLAEIIIGKAIPSVLVGLIQSTLVLVVCLFWFNIPMAGSLISLYLGLLIFMVACVGIGLSISAVCTTMQQAVLYSFVLIMPLMLLSGLATPVENMPGVLQIATYANPLRFGIDIVRRVYLEGASLLSIWHDLIPLITISAITLPLAGWLFRHRLV